MTAAQIIADWTGRYSGGFGIADDLRCSAMECQELGVDRQSFLDAAAAAGYNRSTASRCWSFVREQDK